MNFVGESLRNETGNYFNISKEILCLIDSEGKIKLINPVFQKSLGYTIAELQDHSIESIIETQELNNTLFKLMDQVSKNIEEQTIFSKVITKNKTVIPVKMKVTKILEIYYVNFVVV